MQIEPTGCTRGIACLNIDAAYYRTLLASKVEKEEAGAEGRIMHGWVFSGKERRYGSPALLSIDGVFGGNAGEIESVVAGV